MKVEEEKKKKEINMKMLQDQIKARNEEDG